MKDLEIAIKGQRCAYNELSSQDRELVDKARSAARRAYAPYSRFKVGAAIRLDNGEIVEGANQENAAFPSGTCAERTACYYAHASHPQNDMETIAISSIGTDGKQPALPTAPCGACRQALLEYETLAGRNLKVILDGADEIYVIPSVRSLLPLAFSEF